MQPPAFCRVGGGAVLWAGNETDPDTVFVDYVTGERCTGPATATCLPFFQARSNLPRLAIGLVLEWCPTSLPHHPATLSVQISMDGSACSTAATQTLTFSCPNTTCVTLPHCAASVQYGGGCHCTECSDEGFSLSGTVCESVSCGKGQRLWNSPILPACTPRATPRAAVLTLSVRPSLLPACSVVANS